ncbi:hypothetical protein ACO0LL_13915 [Undibacterium sp. TC4M20W]|uniref:hypothetical protein n=1 Tax=Undibacterium sp. TC4M20W TaxID=3413052 RepID=UPI003BF31010
MAKYDSWIEKNYNYLYLLDDEISKSIVALHLLSTELKVVSSAIYLGTTSADYLPQLKKCFEHYFFIEGLKWIQSLENAYGTSIHPDKESREDYLLSSPAVLIRLEEYTDHESETLQYLLPKIDRLLDQLIAEKKIEMGEPKL